MFIIYLCAFFIVTSNTHGSEAAAHHSRQIWWSESTMHAARFLIRCQSPEELARLETRTHPHQTIDLTSLINAGSIYVRASIIKKKPKDIERVGHWLAVLAQRGVCLVPDMETRGTLSEIEGSFITGMASLITHQKDDLDRAAHIILGAASPARGHRYMHVAVASASSQSHPAAVASTTSTSKRARDRTAEMEYKRALLAAESPPPATFSDSAPAAAASSAHIPGELRW